MLKHEGCLDVLKRSRFPEPVTKVFDPANSLFSLVTKYMYYKDIGSEILSRLREVATIEQDINAPGKAGMTRLQLCVTGHRKDYTHFICLEELKVLLQLNADVDVIDEAGSTVLSNILHTTQYTYMIKNKREALELILLENPSAELTKNAVEKAFAFAEIIETEEFNHMGFTCMGEYIMDGEEHSLFGKRCCALRFFGPLLLEAGFRSCKQTLMAAVENFRLNPSERDYLQEYLDTPRGLMSCCRDTITPSTSSVRRFNAHSNESQGVYTTEGHTVDLTKLA